MIAFLRKYKGFIYGFLIQRILTAVLLYFELIHIDDSALLTNALIFIFSWLLISLPIHYFSFLKEHKTVTFKLILLILLFLGIIINDMNSKIPDNPITFIGLVSVGLCFVSIIIPSYFKKYALITIGFYLLALGYFYYIRIYNEDENYYLQQEKEVKLILVIPFVVLFFAWFYQQWKWLKTLESRKSKAELSLLKSQINPHFFFNTLNNLYGLVIEKSPDAPSVVLKLSDLMRYTIYMGKEDMVLLKDETEYLGNYIELHKIRYQKKVDILFDYSQDKDYQVAPLMFIIPLENAFKHGVESLMENAYIHLKIRAYNDVIYFEIENNFEINDPAHKMGIGIENLTQRLELLYPDQYKIQTEIRNSTYKLTLTIETI